MNMSKDKNRLLNGTDAQALNNIQELSATINGLKNNIANALTPSLKNLSKWFDKDSILVSSIRKIAEVIGDHPYVAATLWALGSVGGSIAKSFIGYMLQAKAFQMMGVGIGGSAVKEITKTALWSKVGAVLTSKTMWLRVGGLLGGAIGASIGGSVAANNGDNVAGGAIGGAVGGWAGAKYGGLLGAKIGTVFGPWGTAIGGLLGAGVGAIGGSWLGGYAGGKAGNLIAGKPENEPTNAQDTSEYNSERTSTESSPIPEVAQTQHNVVSLNGIDTLKSLLRDINSNTKAVVTELRNSGMRPGTNLAT